MMMMMMMMMAVIKLQHSENAICKLFEKYISDELDIVHGHLFS